MEKMIGDAFIKARDSYFLFDKIIAGSPADESGLLAGFSQPHIEGIMPDDIEMMFGKDQRLAYLDQIHSDRIHVVNQPGVYTGDGIFTRAANMMLVVRTADCLPLYFFNREEDIIGMVHMGWRPAQAGILENVPYELSSFKVIAGAGMRQCCYHVGREFTEYGRISGYVHRQNTHWSFDPIRFAKEALVKQGLRPQNFLDIAMCSVCSKEGLPSYRRNKTTRRTLSFIMR